MTLLMLHGFLGLPDDWEPVISSLEKTDPSLFDRSRIHVPHLAVWATREKITDFLTFAREIGREVDKLILKNQGPVILAGYSMGARLALACLVENPERYAGAVLISLNPGFDHHAVSEREARLKSDLKWAKELKTAGWQDVWDAWNQQEVLKPGSRLQLQRHGGPSDSKEKQATEKQIAYGRLLEGHRQAWARAMDIWSLARQPDWANEMTHLLLLEKSFTLMTGTEDKKFTDIAKTIIGHEGKGLQQTTSGTSSIRHRAVLGAGHRLLIEAPGDVASEISLLFNTVKT